METTFIRKFSVVIIFAIMGAVAYGHVAPTASLDLRYTRTQIMEQARAYLVGLGYDLKNYQQDAWLGFEGITHLFLQARMGMTAANEAIRADTLPTHNWYVTWYDRNLSMSQNPETIRMWISPAGKILGFEHVIQDTVIRPSISSSEAEQKARSFLTDRGIDLMPYYLKTSSQTHQPGRLDHRFMWATRDTTVNATIWARVQGTEVAGFRSEFEPGNEWNRRFSDIWTAATLFTTGSLVAVFLLFFFIVILFLKKYHEGEVGTRTALMVFIGLLLVNALSIANQYPLLASDMQMGDLNKYYMRMVMFVFNVFIVQVFVSVMVFASWSVGESSSRTTWPKKLAAMDSVLFRKFFSLDVGESVLRGYMLGLILLGAYSALVFGLIKMGGFGIVVRGTNGIPESYVASVQPLLNAIGTAAFGEIVFRFFFISYIKEKTKKTWIGVLVSTIIWTFVAFTMGELPFGFPRLEYTFLGLFAFGLIFSFVFLKYDLLTAIITHFMVVVLNQSIPIVDSSNEKFHIASLIELTLLVAPLVVAAVGIARRQRFQFTLETTPAHIQRITERERMAKELEIARKVQLSLLPKVNPVVPGYDIAGICIPALEVGGDYYDFVNLGGRKLGIAIGDVSGKGVPAAIYMTLTKGILQSHAEDNVSPKIVLSKVNSLMYRTIDRNSFVSMFYAILDVEQRNIRFARAGQCPIILTQRSGEKGSFISPKGMALGLERGDVFDSVLEEQELELRSGEVLVFYTDGFTEAMKANGDEFGEHRLVSAVARNRGKSSNEIIQGVCKEVDVFTEGTQQHDDMTMVVVKVG
jgi:phosphoserine phosphatase RsbU/P